jgi:hypothetical protein
MRFKINELSAVVDVAIMLIGTRGSQDAARCADGEATAAEPKTSRLSAAEDRLAYVVQ